MPATLCAAALLVAACGGDGDEVATTATADDQTEATGDGVTSDPCPNPVNADNGCIYLGLLSDLTEGPFTALAGPVTDAQQAFWLRVNENGGIGGRFDVDVTTYTRDNKYDPGTHEQLYEEIEPNILALAQTFGSPTTAAIVDAMRADDVLGTPASSASRWDFEAVVLESGSPYCTESMNALDWLGENREAPTTVLAVHHPDEYGEDGAAGARRWAEANDAGFVAVEQLPRAAGGSTSAAVEAIVSQDPDVVVVTTAPAELAEIVGEAVAQGYQGQFIGNSPTWSPGLLQSPAADALTARYLQASPWEPYGADTPAHRAMREYLPKVLGGEVQGNDGYTSGWMSSYPLLAALERAAEADELTREGLVAAVATLESVDYEGALPDGAGDFAGDPEQQIVRATVINEPTADVPSGLQLLSDGFVTGPTAQAATFEAPCDETTAPG